MIDPAVLSERGKQALSAVRPAGLTLLKPRDVESHKGTYGRALIVGGSLGMAGAVGLSGMSALRTGAGLVRLAVPRGIVTTVASYEPAYMTLPLPEDGDGRLEASSLSSLLDAAMPATAVAVGPGLGRSHGVSTIVSRLFTDVVQPAVFDADALNALAEHCDALRTHAGPRILTPHPGEMARLTGEDVTALQAERQETARRYAAAWGHVVLLKGAFTVVAAPDGRAVLLPFANPGLASAGPRDALAGLPPPLADFTEHPQYHNHLRVKMSERNIERIRFVPEGGGRLDIPEELQLNCHRGAAHRHLDVFGRMRWDEPGPTITAMFDNFTRGRFAHPSEDRSITGREGARLQSFPDWFKFKGPKKDVARQIGNAVPPQLAEALGRELIHACAP